MSLLDTVEPLQIVQGQVVMHTSRVMGFQFVLGYACTLDGDLTRVLTNTF